MDSVVVLALRKRAVGAQRVLALIMPEKESQVESSKDAFNLAKNLGIKTGLIDITLYLRALGPINSSPLASS